MNNNALSITYGAASNVTFVGFSDYDWAGHISDRKPVGGYMFPISGKPITWSSKKRASVSLLNCEAEYFALSEAVK